MHSAIYDLFSVVVFHRSVVNWGKSEFIWCSGIPQMYDQLEKGAAHVRVHLV